MYVFHTNQIGSTINSQSNFLFVADTCNIQCSSDIFELRIRVLYERILHIRLSIRTYTHIYTCVYGPLLCISIHEEPQAVKFLS